MLYHKNVLLSLAIIAWASNTISANLSIFVTSQLNGEIYTCQCGGNNLGGLAAIAKMVNDSKDSGAITLSPGNILGYVPEPKKDSLILGIIKDIKYDAIGLGWSDLLEGAEGVLSSRDELKVSWVNCNLVFKGKPLTSPFKLVETNGIKVGITSAIAPARLESPLLKGCLTNLNINDPVENVSMQLIIHEADVDLFIILSDMTQCEENEIKKRYTGSKEILVISNTGERGRDTTRWQDGYYVVNPGARGRNAYAINIDRSFKTGTFLYLPVNIKAGQDEEVATQLDIYRRVHDKPVETLQAVNYEELNNGQKHVPGKDSLVLFYSPACMDCHDIIENHIKAISQKGSIKIRYVNITDEAKYSKLMDLQKKMKTVTREIPVALYKGVLYDGKEPIIALLDKIK